MQKKKRTSKVKSTEEKTNEETKLPLLNDILTSDSNVNPFNTQAIEDRKKFIEDYLSNPNNQFFPINDKNGNENYINSKILEKLKENKNKIKDEISVHNYLGNRIIIKDIPEEKDDNKKVGILVKQNDKSYLVRISTIKKYSKKLSENQEIEFKDLFTGEKSTINLMNCIFEKIDVEPYLNELEQNLKIEEEKEKKIKERKKKIQKEREEREKKEKEEKEKKEKEEKEKEEKEKAEKNK
jgi:hypothetical protein